MKSIEIIKKVGNLHPGRIIFITGEQGDDCYYYNKDGSLTIIEDNQKITIKKTFFKEHSFIRPHTI